MKTKKLIAAATAIIGTVTLLGSCIPDDNIQPTLYGPPPTDPIETTAFIAENNTPTQVYGPPQTDSVEITAATTETEYDVEDNIPEDVYGPPEWFE